MTAASTWSAVALTEPAFEANIQDKGQVQLTLVLIVVSVLAGFAGDLVRTSPVVDDTTSHDA